MVDKIINEVINNYVGSREMANNNFYWSDTDLRTINRCKDALSNIYNHMLEHGLSKNVFIVEQLGDIINRIDKLI